MAEERNRDGKVWERPYATNPRNPNWSTETEVQEFLYGFVRCIKPEQCLEIGTFEGNGAIAIGSALQDNGHGMLYTVDVEDYGQEKNIENTNIVCVQCIIDTDYMYALKDFQYDFIFIDDGHSYEECRRDLRYAYQHIKSGGYIVCHDYITFAGVKKAVDEFVSTHEILEFIRVDSAEGLAIMRVTKQ